MAVPIIFPAALLIVAATIAASTIPAMTAGANVIVACARAFFWDPPSAYPSIQT